MQLGVISKLNLKVVYRQPQFGVLFLSAFTALKNTLAMTESGLSPMDPNSFSRPDLAVVTNIFISLDVNFERKVLSGNVDLTVKKVNESVNEVILDARGLNIEAIYETETNKKLNYTLSEICGEFGSKLTVELPPKETNNYIVSVRYETSPDASGLQWLSPEQTAGRKVPYVFSQFQAIHARSVLPCQDTPAVKAKYSAVISAPKNITVIMSAIMDHKRPLLDRTLFHFKQDVPVQSYLIAIAAGDIESREIGPRSKVWAEKEIIEAAAYEFSETEHQLKTAEEICGPYVWGIYDLLVLPPSFPFGGMENPCLTFVTPTLLAGDKSLANVVAHEISHSWTGNLVTNANFEHFWLNEGFTMFVERKILGRLKNKQLQDFQAYGGSVELQETINQLGKDNPLTRLVVDLKGVHPDDAFSTVPYEKGYIFLRYLENVVGGPDVFEPFLRQYFDTYKYKSITTDVFKTFFENYFKETEAINSIDWQTWLYAPGMPPVIPEYDQTLRKTCSDYSGKIINWDGIGDFPISDAELKALIPDQLIQLLQELVINDQPLSLDKLKALETALQLKDVKNAEMKFRWLRICIKGHWEDMIQPTLQWLNKVGRMKYCRPLYRDLNKWEVSRPLAIKNYEENKKYMMYVSAYTIGKDLGLIK